MSIDFKRMACAGQTLTEMLLIASLIVVVAIAGTKLVQSGLKTQTTAFADNYKKGGGGAAGSSPYNASAYNLTPVSSAPAYQGGTGGTTPPAGTTSGTTTPPATP